MLRQETIYFSKEWDLFEPCQPGRQSPSSSNLLVENRLIYQRKMENMTMYVHIKRDKGVLERRRVPSSDLTCDITSI